MTAPTRSLAVLLSTAWALFGASPTHAQEVDVGQVGYVLGDTAAAVTVVEFGDFACGACGEFWRATWPSVRTELIDGGRVLWRHVPFLLGFRRGDAAANAAECAAEQGAFWQMHDRLFDGQESWMGGRRPEEVFQGYAAALGLDVSAFTVCYDGELGRERTRAATRVARDAGVRATPTFFVNGRRVLGALPYDVFRAIVEEAARMPAAGPGR